MSDPETLIGNLEQWDILPGGTYEPAFIERMKAIDHHARDAVDRARKAESRAEQAEAQLRRLGELVLGLDLSDVVLAPDERLDDLHTEAFAAVRSLDAARKAGDK